MQLQDRLVRMCVAGFFGAALVFAAGCSKSDEGPPRHPASGTVTLNGEPVASGMVTLVNERGDVTGAELGAGGAFTIADGLEAGSYKVYVVPPPTGMPTDPTAPKDVEVDVTIPQKFQSVATSELTVEITEGENDLKIAMEGE